MPPYLTDKQKELLRNLVALKDVPGVPYPFSFGQGLKTRTGTIISGAENVEFDFEDLQALIDANLLRSSDSGGTCSITNFGLELVKSDFNLAQRPAQGFTSQTPAEKQPERLGRPLMSRQQDLQKELTLWQRRLQKRKEQKATQGISADPSIDIEIEDIEARVAKLQAELAELKQNVQPQPKPAPPSAVSLPAVEVAEPNPELASLRVQPRIFLCHASEDKHRAKELYHLLKDAGYRPWLDKFDLLPERASRPAVPALVSPMLSPVRFKKSPRRV